MPQLTMNQLINSIQRREPLDVWFDARSRISQERRAIESFIRSGGTAYGLTSMFGHRDNVSSNLNEQIQLLNYHCIGTPTESSDVLSRSVLTMKLCQLSQGGSGISRQTYEQLLSMWPRDMSHVVIDFDASYGSGDVVPAAWLARQCVSPSMILPGDVMCLINGSFVGAGFALSLYNDLHESLSSSVSIVHRLSRFALNTGSVQTTISLRDTSPLEHTAHASLTQLSSAIENSASCQSANPKFDFDTNGHASAHSTSDFLDFDMSQALVSMMNTLIIASSYLVGSSRWASAYYEACESGAEASRYVQYPKVIKAYYDNMPMQTVHAAQAESLGIEDVSDSSLSLAVSCKRCLELLNKQLILSRELVTALNDSESGVL